MGTNRKVAQFRTDERKEKIRRVVERRQPSLTVVLENVHDPHNVSAVIRSCDAVGILEVSLIYNGGQKFPKLGAKSSASARKWVNQKHYESAADCFSELRKEGKKIYTTGMSSDAVSLYDLNLTEPVALVFGNEHEGVTEEAISLADGNFLIPQVGVIQSLNISVACAVSIYEAFRQRLNAGMYSDSQLSQDELAILYNDFLAR